MSSAPSSAQILTAATAWWNAQQALLAAVAAQTAKVAAQDAAYKALAIAQAAVIQAKLDCDAAEAAFSRLMGS